jgi:hypothetical protein
MVNVKIWTIILHIEAPETNNAPTEGQEQPGDSKKEA